MKEVHVGVTFSVGAVSLNVEVAKRESEQAEQVLVESKSEPVLIEKKEEE